MPAGKYAKAALEKLGAWAAAEPKFAMAENVRAALALVGRGEAALGIVYETDAKVEPNVKIVGALPGRLASGHRLSGGADGERKAGSGEVSRVPAFSGTAQVIFERYGFTVSGEGRGPERARHRRRDVQPNPRRMDRGPSCRCGSRWWPRVAALPFGIAIAWLLARKDFWGKALLDGIVHLPLVLPPVVTGYLLLITFGRRGAVGAFLADIGIVFSFRWTGAALACGVMALSTAGARHPALV